MRLLVLMTDDRWSPGARLLAMVGGGLSARGEVVTIAALHDGRVEREATALLPQLAHRGVVGRGFVRQLASVRGMVTALRPEAILIAGEGDALLAALAIGKRGGVLQRIPVGDAGGPAWRGTIARSRTHLVRWGDESLALSWPPPSKAHVRQASDHAAEHRGPHRPPHAVPNPVPYGPVTLPIPLAHLLLVPSQVHNERTAMALRAAAHLLTRQHALTLTLLGDAAELQSTRLHAAAVGLTARVSIRPLDALLQSKPVDAAVVWVAADGDLGALCTLAAMQRQLPVVVPHDAPFASMVTPRATGFLAVDGELPTLVAELARLLADPAEYHAMAQASAARAARLYAWDTLVDHVAELLARAAGANVAHVTARPSFTPA